MKSNFFGIWVKQAVAIVLGLSLVSACTRREVPAQSAFGAGAIVGANYSENGIQWFNVDGAGGMPLGPYTGGGGHVCCASYPRTWTPDFKVKIKWVRSDVRDESGTSWKMKELEKTVGVEKYTGGGNVYVLFFPNDEVKVFVSNVGVGNPDFPTKPGYPEDAQSTKETK